VETGDVVKKVQATLVQMRAAREISREVGAHVAEFYSGLVNAHIPTQEAMSLTLQMQNSLIHSIGSTITTMVIGMQQTIAEKPVTDAAKEDA
jgi:hypothetical protein